MAPSRADVEPWLKAETVRMLATVESLRDRDLTQDSVLPGWSLAHLLTHLARNANALGNLLVWARTGVETPMYQSITQRTADINLGATRPGAVVLDDVVDSAARLRDNSEMLTAQDWQNLVRTAQGRTIPAATVPWLRLREVVIHHVDLGAPIGDVPPEVAASLLNDVTAWIRNQSGWPSLRIETSDTAQSVTTANGNAVTIGGTAADLVAWLIGRSPGENLSSAEPLPALPAWL
jgi:maleylpyruvate isomerase